VRFLEAIIKIIQEAPVYIGAFFFIGTMVLIFLLGAIAMSSIFTERELVNNNFIGALKFAFLAEIIGALLIFSLADSAVRYSSFQSKINKEISILKVMQDLERKMGKFGLSLKKEREKYMFSVRKSEWLSMKDGNASSVTDNAMEKWVSLISFPLTEKESYPVYAYLRLFLDLNDTRSGRLSDSSSAFSNLIWLSSFIGLFISIVMGWFLGSYNFSIQLLLGSLLTFVVSFIIYLSIIMSCPVSASVGFPSSIYNF
jgi:hypothetical protein